jgi:kinesin family protein 2/24
MHVDSQRAGDKSNTTQSNSNGSTDPETILARLASSSRDSNPIASEIPFKERIRPSMVVSWNEPPGHDFKIDIPGDIKLATILCPVAAVQETVNGAFDQALDLTGSDMSGGTRYLCALITPGQMPDAYELNLWRQIIIDVSMMENEVILEYDAGTRYYYMSV